MSSNSATSKHDHFQYNNAVIVMLMPCHALQRFSPVQLAAFFTDLPTLDNNSNMPSINSLRPALFSPKIGLTQTNSANVK